jgi:hypothetical protein
MDDHRRKFLKTSLAATAFGVIPLVLTTHAMKDSARMIGSDTAQRKKLRALLGDLPAHTPHAPQLIRKEKHENYTLEYFEFDFNGIEPVPGLLLIPDKRNEKMPCMLYCHAHFGTYEIGKEELLNGRAVMPAYAPVYAEKGIMALAIDSWCFGERKHLVNGSQGESDTFKKMLWEGKTLFGMMLFDEMRALDYLLSRPEADTNRVGVFGLSMGATKAWWLAALDTRITLCMDLCCMTDYDELMRINNLKGHGIYYFIPSLLKHFSTSTINALITPRAHVSLNGRLDDLTPSAGVEKVRDYLLPLYRKAGKEEDCLIQLFDCGHEELPEMRNIFLQWMDKHLAGG